MTKFAEIQNREKGLNRSSPACITWQILITA